jgi:thiol-disulfide isomerase/thioredoxin
MRVNIRLWALVFVLIAGVSFACSLPVEETEPTKTEVMVQNEPRQLPAFAMTDVSGNAVNLSALKGRKVFVNLWATWCPPCRAEIPSIEELADKTDRHEVIFVMLSLDKSFDIARQFATARKMKVPIYYPAEELPALFNIDGIPATFIFDEQGNLVKQVNGSDDYSKKSYVDLLTK